MFLQLSVILFTEGVSASVHAGIPPPLEPDTPPRADPPISRPPRQTPPPLHSACWEIRATSGRYASYWNAYLFSDEVEIL